MTWLFLIWNIFALAALLFQSRIHNSLLIFLLIWKYLVGVVYALNLYSSIFTSHRIFSNIQYKTFCSTHFASRLIFSWFYIHCLSPLIHMVKYMFRVFIFNEFIQRSNLFSKRFFLLIVYAVNIWRIKLK